jgi:hypothetical protein
VPPPEHWPSSAAVDIPGGGQTNKRLVKIARDERILDAKHVSHLPPNWGTLYELTKPQNEQFKAKIDDDTIRPKRFCPELTQSV